MSGSVGAGGLDLRLQIVGAEEVADHYGLIAAAPAPLMQGRA